MTQPWEDETAREDDDATGEVAATSSITIIGGDKLVASNITTGGDETVTCFSSQSQLNRRQEARPQPNESVTTMAVISIDG